MTAVFASLGAALIAAAVSIISLCLQRKWKKDDQSAGKLDEISAEVQSVKNTLTAHIATDEEHFDNVLEDIDAYEKYCVAHPQFENRKAVQSIQFIVEIYDECKRKNDFI